MLKDLLVQVERINSSRIYRYIIEILVTKLPPSISWYQTQNVLRFTIQHAA